MKTLTEYNIDHIIYNGEVNEGIKDLFKRFWSWLTNKPKDTYDYDSQKYDENEMKKYINTHTSSSIKFKPIDFDHVKQAIQLSGAKNNDNKKVGLYVTDDYLSNPSYREHPPKFIAGMFDSSDLKQVCIICAYYTDDKTDTMIIPLLDIDKRYIGIVDFSKLHNHINEIAIKEKCSAIDYPKTWCNKLHKANIEVDGDGYIRIY